MAFLGLKSVSIPALPLPRSSLLPLLLLVAIQFHASVPISARAAFKSAKVANVSTPSLAASIYGEVILGGLFPVHDKGEKSCGSINPDRGIERLEAMLFTIDEINERPDILANTKLGVSIFDTCGRAPYALEQSLEFIRASITSLPTEFICRDRSLPVARSSPTAVAGVVGGSYSTVSMQVANLLRLFKIPQISYASTSASLSDKIRYDYFVRTVPPDNFQAKALVDIVEEFNWTYVSVVHSEGEYGESGIDFFKHEARARNICIAADVKISQSATNATYDLAMKDLLDKPEAKVVIIFLRVEDATGVLSAASRRNLTGRFVWVASDAWGNRLSPVIHHENVAQGAITLELQSNPIKRFEEYFLTLNPKTNKRNPWFKEYWEQTHKCFWNKGSLNTADPSIRYTRKRCTGNERISRKLTSQESKVQFIYDAVYAFAHALDQMQQDLCPGMTFDECPQMSTIDGERFLKDYLLNVSFPDGHGANVKFDNKGDALGRYQVMNFQRNRRTREYEYKVVGNWRNGLFLNHSEIVWAGDTKDIPGSQCSEPCKEGWIKNIKGGEQCCWVCTKCDPWEYIKDEKTCEPCKQGYWPYVNKTGCLELHVQHMIWTSIHAVIPMALATLGIMSTLFVISIFVIFNCTPVVMASGRELSYMLLSGCLFSYFMTFVLLAPPSVGVCAIQRFGVGFGFSVIYSALLIKTNRISRIFVSARRSAKRPPFISPKSQIVMTLILILIQVLFTFIWLVREPPGTRLYHPDSREPLIILKCRSDDISFLMSLVYNMLLIIICTVYAVKTRKIPENFNESKFIGFSMYTTCIIWLAFVPIYFGTLNSFKIQVTTLCVSISLSANVALICLFLPKIYIIVFQPQKNVRKLTMNSTSYKMAPTAATANTTTINAGNNHNNASSSEHFHLNVHQPANIQHHHHQHHSHHQQQQQQTTGLLLPGGNTTETDTDRCSMASL